MKKIKLENKMIVPVFQFLQGATLKGKATRGRNQFMKRLEEKSKEFNEALTEVRKEYFLLDKEGELIVEDGNFIFKLDADKKELEDKIKELNEEELEIQFGEYSTKYEALFKALDEYEESLSGQDALGYNELMDAYEVNEANEEEK